MENNNIWEQIGDRIEKLEERVTRVENRTAEHDTQYAVINTKLSAILWGIGIVATALVGVLIKLVFKV